MKRNREHLTNGKGVHSGFKDSPSLETMDLDQPQSARLGDFLQLHMKGQMRLPWDGVRAGAQRKGWMAGSTLREVGRRRPRRWEDQWLAEL